MFENFRGKLQTVQQDFTTSMKTLGDKSKDSKVKRRPRYEESWVLLHKRAKDCAQTAEAVDREVVMLSVHWERRRAAVTQLQEQLQTMPGFISELNAITTRIAHLEGDFEEMESRLVYLETLCCQCEQQRFKQYQINQLDNYKKKKRRELEALKVELDSEHAQKVAELEHATQQKLKDRQKIYEKAFNQDMEHYLSTGYLQLRDVQPTGGQLCSLDQLTITDVSDQEALDKFLSSTSDDISAASSLTSGPDLESWPSESPRSSLSQGLPTDSQLANQSAARGQEEEVASEDSDEPLVQSDEEDVQVDMSLVVLPEVGPARSSDESDSAGDLRSG
ncbi:dysbindin-A-like isoform X2 [Myripristis murdjan]|uniref:dysbindin-A-like isoform X2 n=1 Tax=Myripristis murdjan TaxID=586833 RepID=UPI0011763580|nr:dysbindin-A-like isoform X2 [Myripristis murdjan]